MPVHDEIGIRMKKFYEEIPKFKLYRRMPVIVRIDGKSFHSFTRGFNKPFDSVLIKSMQDTMKYLCENIQGCVLGYHQSDEISLLLIDYKSLDTEAFFDYEVQKLCSVTASMATLAFNMFFKKNIDKFGRENIEDWDEGGTNRTLSEDERKILYQCEVYYKAKLKGAMFDSRCFNLTKEEVTNYFYWRQLDAIRNSIQMVGQSYFSSKELHKKNLGAIQDMLFTQKNINWNDYPVHQKRGSCCTRTIELVGDTERSRWIIDLDIPDFVNDGRYYIERLFNFE